MTTGSLYHHVNMKKTFKINTRRASWSTGGVPLLFLLPDARTCSRKSFLSFIIWSLVILTASDGGALPYSGLNLYCAMQELSTHTCIHTHVDVHHPHMTHTFHTHAHKHTNTSAVLVAFAWLTCPMDGCLHTCSGIERLTRYHLHQAQWLLRLMLTSASQGGSLDCTNGCLRSRTHFPADRDREIRRFDPAKHSCTYA